MPQLTVRILDVLDHYVTLFTSMLTSQLATHHVMAINVSTRGNSRSYVYPRIHHRSIKLQQVVNVMKIDRYIYVYVYKVAREQFIFPQ